MDRTKFLTAVVIALLLLNLGTLGYLFISRDNDPRPLHGKGGPGAYIIKKLQFTQQQEEEFITLRDAHRKAMRHLADSLHDVQEEYFSGLKTPNPDTARARSYEENIAAIEVQMHRTTFEHFVLVRRICNPAQQKIFDELITGVIRSMSPPPPGAPPRGRQ